MKQQQENNTPRKKKKSKNFQSLNNDDFHSNFLISLQLPHKIFMQANC